LKVHHSGHGDPAGNVFQNVCGILDDVQMTYDLRKSIGDNRSTQNRRA
jgi:hypothetical protein